MSENEAAELNELDAREQHATDESTIGSTIRLARLHQRVWGIDAQLADITDECRAEIRKIRERNGYDDLRDHRDALLKRIREEVTMAGQLELPMGVGP